MNGYGLFPIKDKAMMSVNWVAEYKDGRRANLLSESRSITEYFCFFFFPIGIYKIVERTIDGRWYPDVNFSLKFNSTIEAEEALVQLNRLMIKKVIDGKIVIQ